jgi:hypothetical protein
MNYWAVTISTRPFQPTSTLLIKLVEALISSEPEPDEKHRKRVRWIYEHTHRKVNMHLSIVELAVFKNIDKGLNCEIELGENTFYLTELYNILDEISKELSNIVIEIAKKYAFDVPTLNIGKGVQSISIDDIGK